ncbi:MAG: LamG-like jellyroll fold domain-containing protein [Bacteroidales bacterium]|nr:LamG-like jellyroll fold domain-containing protein [Bacteroidales bacterium]
MNKKTISLLTAVLLSITNLLYAQGTTTNPSRIESTFMRSEFVQGREIIFANDFSTEPIGAIPTTCNTTEGTVEIGERESQQFLLFSNHSKINLNDQPELSDQCTIEFDFFCGSHDYDFQYTVGANNNKWGESFQLNISTNEYRLVYRTPDDMGKASMGQLPTTMFRTNAWNHVAITYSRHMLTAYINGTSIFKVENCKQPSTLWFAHNEWEQFRNNKINAITNIVIANEIIPFDVNIEQERRLESHSIVFESDTLLAPQSMTDIYRLRNFMQRHSDLSVIIEQHTNGEPNDEALTTLTQRQAEIIATRLTAMGIAAERITAKGVGTNEILVDPHSQNSNAINKRTILIIQQ